MKRPAFQFYPGDWQRDSALRSCSVPARGLWIEMMCIMHQAAPYGHLILNGNPISIPQLARIVGATERETTRWMDELETAGVFSRDLSGVIFSRRMVADEHLRNVRAECGRLGGNPDLVGSKVNQKSTPEVNQNITPSSSSSVSSSSSKQTTLSGLPPDDGNAEGKKLNGFTEPAKNILAFLNEKTGRSYRALDGNGKPTSSLRIIVDRLKSGVSADDCRSVVAMKCREWGANNEMRPYLRPSTLFRASKFEDYLGQLRRGE